MRRVGLERRLELRDRAGEVARPRQEEAQRLGRVLRKKQGGGRALFYAVVTADSRDQEFAAHRQLFLTEQGYPYRIVQLSELVDGSLVG